MELSELRARLDALDDIITDTFTQRMALVAQDEKREERIIARLTERAGADMAPYVAALYRTLLSQSRAYQSRLREKGEA